MTRDRPPPTTLVREEKIPSGGSTKSSQEDSQSQSSTSSSPDKRIHATVDNTSKPTMPVSQQEESEVSDTTSALQSSDELQLNRLQRWSLRRLLKKVKKKFLREVHALQDKADAKLRVKLIKQLDDFYELGFDIIEEEKLLLPEHYREMETYELVRIVGETIDELQQRVTDK